MNILVFLNRVAIKRTGTASAVIFKGEKFFVTELIAILRTGLLQRQIFPFLKKFLYTLEFYLFII